MRLVVLCIAAGVAAGCGSHRYYDVTPDATRALRDQRAAVGGGTPTRSLGAFMAEVRELQAGVRPTPPSALPTLETSDQALAAALLEATLAPSPDAFRAVAEEYRRLRVYDQAHEYLNRALVMAPKDARAHEGLARLWRDVGLPHWRSATLIARCSSIPARQRPTTRSALCSRRSAAVPTRAVSTSARRHSTCWRLRAQQHLLQLGARRGRRTGRAGLPACAIARPDVTGRAEQRRSGLRPDERHARVARVVCRRRHRRRGAVQHRHRAAGRAAVERGRALVPRCAGGRPDHAGGGAFARDRPQSMGQGRP